MKRHLDNVGLVLSLIMVGFALVFLIGPILVAIAMSFDARDYLGPLPPTSFSTRWYQSFFSNAYYLDGLKTSLILATVATGISTAIGVSAALALHRYEFWGKSALATLFLSPLVVPGVVLGFALLLFFARLGIVDGFPRLLGGHIIITIPYTVRSTFAGLVGIRGSMTEAAMSLGANERQAFWDITFPLAKTGIIAGAVFAFAFSMDDVAVSIFLTDPHNYTLPVAMVSMIRAHFDLTIAAAAVLLVLFTLGIILVLDFVVGLDKLIGKGVYRP